MSKWPMRVHFSKSFVCPRVVQVREDVVPFSFSRLLTVLQGGQLGPHSWKMFLLEHVGE
jgi:hypothetical protein